MEKVKLYETEVLESNRIFEFPEGRVKVYELEVHEIYRRQPVTTPKLVIEDALVRTKSFIAKARAEFADLNSLMSELTARQI